MAVDERNLSCAVMMAAKRNKPGEVARLTGMLTGAGFSHVEMVIDRERFGVVSTWATCVNRLAAAGHPAVVFQDDVTVCAGLATFVADLLDNWPQDAGMVSLYASARYENQLSENWRGLVDVQLTEAEHFWGACGVVIPEHTAQRIMTTDAWRKWARRDGLDSVLYRAVQELGLKVLLCVPSLVQHVGAESTLNPKAGPAAGWRASSRFPGTEHVAEWWRYEVNRAIVGAQ